jgi:mitochondrial inner membrane protease subunit 1
MSALPRRRLALYCISAFCTFELYQHHLHDWAHGSGPSMYPTIPSQSSNMIINHRYRLGRGVKLGDIVQYRSPLFRDAMVAKRIIGMPGDFVVADEGMSVSVGGAEGPWMQEAEGEKKQREEPMMVRVPEGHVWVAGDNLAFSRDSRFYGPVPMALIVGKIEYNTEGWFGWKKVGGEQMVEVPVVEVD